MDPRRKCSGLNLYYCVHNQPNNDAGQWFSGIVAWLTRNVRPLDLDHARCVFTNGRLDLLPAWAYVGAVHAGAQDPYPREMYLFIMDAQPKLMEGVSEPTRKAQAQLRVEEWIRWHLAQLGIMGGKPYDKVRPPVLHANQYRGLWDLMSKGDQPVRPFSCPLVT